MYKRVDGESQEEIRGFSYVNKNGHEEVVKMASSYVVVVNSVEASLNDFYYEDIPNLIKALQAAYDYKKGVK